MKYRDILGFSRSGLLRGSLAGLLWLAVHVLSACAPLLQKPHLELQGVELRGATFTRQSLRLMVRIDNPNPFALKLDGFDFVLSSGDAQLASGTLPEPVVIPAHTASTLDLDAAVNALATIRPLSQALRGDGKLPYRLSGRAVMHNGGTLVLVREGLVELTRR